MYGLLCVVRDRVASSIGPVMMFPAVPSAIRSFSDLALDPQTMVNRHTADFDLVQIGTVDQSTGDVIACMPPVVLLSGASWLAAQERPASSDGQLSLLKEA